MEEAKLYDDIVRNHNIDAKRRLLELKTPLAKYYVGMLYYMGITEDFNSAKALTQFGQANIPEGYDKIGLMYLNGEGVDKNLELAYDWFKKAGDISFLKLGIIFLSEQNYAKAREYFLKSLKISEHIDAYNNLGFICFVEKNKNKAKEYFLKSNKLMENSYAFCQLGLLTENKKEKYFNLTKAFDFVDINIDNLMNIWENIKVFIDREELPIKSYKIYNNLGYIHLIHLRDMQKALKYYEQANDIKENMLSLNQIAHIHIELTKNYEKAYEYLSRALETEYPRSSVKQSVYDNIGVIHELKNDYSKAIHFWELSKSKESYLNLSILYLTNKLQENQINYTKAIEYLDKSLSIGESIKALQLLSGIYLTVISKDIEKAFNYLQRAIQFGERKRKDKTWSNIEQSSYEICWTDLGKIYEDKQNYSEALKHYYKYENIHSYNALGYYYLTIEKDIDKALSYYEQALEKFGPNIITLNQLGYLYTCYNLGSETEKTKKLDKAFEYLQRALNLKMNSLVFSGDCHLNILTNIGNIYELRGDYDNAIKYYSQSNTPHSICKIGHIYYLKKNDPDTAIQYYQASNIPEGLISIGKIYLGKNELEIAAQYFQQSGTPDGIVNLAMIYYKYGDPVNLQKNSQKNYLKALEYLLQLPDNVTALNQLGYMYLVGHGVEIDYKKSLEYHERANKCQLNTASFNQLGYLYDVGLGVSKDEDKALQYYQNAVKYYNGKDDPSSYASACNNIGVILERRQKYSEAIEYYHKAVLLNDKTSCCNIGILYQRGTGVNQNYQESIRWFEMANTSSSHVYLAYIYKNGLGVPINYEKAEEHYLIVLNMCPDSISYDPKLFVLSTANEDSYSPSNAVLGLIYYFGIDTKQDKNKALEHFLLSDLSVCNYYIGKIYFELKSYQKSLEYLSKSNNHHSINYLKTILKSNNDFLSLFIRHYFFLSSPKIID